MRAWLWILGTAAGLAGAYAAGKRLRQRSRTRDAMGRFLGAIMQALQAGKLEALMNHTQLHPDGWSDEYAGSLAGQPLIFLVRVRTVDGVEPPGSMRMYTIRWAEAQVTVMSRPAADEETAYMRIHAMLRTAYQRLNGQRPS